MPVVALLFLAGFALWQRLEDDAALRELPATAPAEPTDLAAATQPTANSNGPVFTTPGPTNPQRSTAERWALRWREASQRSMSTERTVALVALMEAIAAESPDLALAWIAAEPDSEVRTALRVAAATGWATSDPRTALRHFLPGNELPRDLAVAAVLRGVRDRPELAVALTQELRAQWPEQAGAFSLYLLGAFAAADAHDASLRFIDTLRTEERPAALAFAFQRWAQQDPESALLHAVRFQNSGEHTAAYEAAVRGWARVDPAALTRHAAGFPAGAEREFALQTALRAWAERDSGAVAEWLVQNRNVKVGPLVLED